MKLHASLCAAAFGFSGLCFAGSFDYKIYEFAANERNSPCFEAVQNIGARLAQQAGVDVVSTACEVSVFNDALLDGIVTYRAEEPLEMTSYADWSNIGTEVLSLYSDEASCEQALGGQTTLFESETGLRSHVAYCQPQSSSMLSKSWKMQIQAAGKGRKEHFFSGFNVSGEPVEGYEGLLQRVTSELDRRGIVVSKSALVSDFFLRLTVGYYHSSRQTFYNDEFLVDDASICASYVGRAQNSFASIQNPPVAVYCNKVPAGHKGIRLHIASMGEAISEPNGYLNKTAPGFYGSIAECESDRPAQMDQSRQGGRQVIEAFCALDFNRRVVMHLLVQE
ncbi:MAG: hypothetical protein RIQ81_2666 [Pseudomonadota bacterium]